MRMLKISTAANVMVFMTNSINHVVGEAGLTLTITASKNGGAFASISPTVSDLGNGWYNLALTTTHTNTLGDLALHITGATSDPSDFLCHIIATDYADATTFGLTNLDAAVTSRAAPGAAMTLTSGERDSTADAILDRSGAIEVGLTLRQCLRLTASALAGKISGAAGTTVTIRNAVADSKDRIVATVDASGNRSALTLDLT